MNPCPSPSVLIVDDEAAIAMAMEVRFRASGFTVCGLASSREEAVSQAIESHPDIVIMDIRLTGEGDGIEAAQEILEEVNTQIIFVSGYAEGDVKRRAMELHPLAYLVKPFALSELISVAKRG